MDAARGNAACFGPFKLDLKAGELHQDGRTTRLQEQPLKVLKMLLDHPGEVVSREEIRRKLWRNDTIVEFDHSINAAIKKLRLSLGDSAEEPQYVETVARRGYRLMVPVEWEGASLRPPLPADRVQRPTGSESNAGNLIGKKISHYRVLEVLGGGGMGVVYKAEDIKLGRRVALKFLPEELWHDAGALERFEREARAASALNHPHICTIYEFGEHEGQPFLAMELLEGETLKHRVTGPLPVDQIISLGVEIAEALEAAHAKGIIHRDIKPANIFVTARGEAKVLDFGLAKLTLEGGPGPLRAGVKDQIGEATGGRPMPQDTPTGPAADPCLTKSGMAMGTAPYMSPEQARGEPLDLRTDLFSFGLVLYEMATGQQAFKDETAEEVRDAILHRAPAPARELNPKVPAKLEELIGNAVEKDRNLRYQNAADMRADLNRLKRDTASGRTAVYDRRGGPARTHRLYRLWPRRGVASAVLVILVGAIAYLLRPPLPLPKILGYRQLTHDGLWKWFVLATDGGRIYFQELSADRKTLILASVSTMGGETVAVRTPLKAPVLEDISPDGTELLVSDNSSGAEDRPFYVVRPMGGSTRRLGEVAGSCGGWVADGRIIYEKGKETVLVDRDGRQAHTVLTMASPGSGWPRSSPDGRLIRFFRNDGLWEVGAGGTNLRALLPGWEHSTLSCCGSWTSDGKYFVFTSQDQATTTWAIREKGDFWHRVNHQPVPLTTGPIEIGYPIPDRVGNRLFARGELPRFQAQRYDARLNKLVPYLGGISAWWFAFSSDGNRVSYVSLPDETLWNSKLDGSERIQLTFPPMGPAAPRWSPDGKQIAFMAHPPLKAWNIYLAQVDGGAPELLLPKDQQHVGVIDNDEMFPDWAPDGKRLVFGGSPSPEKADIRVVDLLTRQVSTVPGSQGLSNPRWSPDGRYIAATDPKLGALQLYDFTTQTWSVPAKLGASQPSWFHDSESLYFFGSEKDEVSIYRIRLSDHKLDRALSLKDLHLAQAPTENLDPSFSLAPDNTLIVPLDLGSMEIYALDWEAP